jgi:hypothetical protein
MNPGAAAEARLPRARAAAAPPRRAVWRGVLLGLLLLPLNQIWLLQMETISGNGVLPTTISLFFNVIFILLFLVWANALVRRLRPRWALTQAELVVVYVMLAIGSSIAGYDNMQVLVPTLTHPFWFATPVNGWADSWSGAPSWLVVTDPQVLYAYYNGASTLYQPAVLRAWASPVLWWSGFIIVWIGVMACMSVLVRSQWSDRERLTFPIIQLPLAMTQPGTGLWRNPLLWIGFAAAGSVDLINGLHYLYPALPYLSIAPVVDNWAANDIVRFLPDLPWRAIGWLPATFYPAVIGLCFLVPLDILFSCVAFFFWWKAMYVLAAALGINQGWGSSEVESTFPYANHQLLGAYLAIAVGPLYVGRQYFGAVWRRIIGRPSEVDDAREGMSYRLAAIGIVVGIALLAAFSIHAGMSPETSVYFFIVYFLISLAVARVRAEFGSPVHDFHHAGPGRILVTVAGTLNLRRQELTMFAVYWWLQRAFRSHPIGHTIEGVQLSARTGSRGRAMTAAIMVAAAVGVFAAFWAWLYYAYHLGVASKWSGGDWQGTEVATTLHSWLQDPTQGSWVPVLAMAAGFAITLLLEVARTGISGWPLHPVAYAISASWSIHLVWLPMLIALVAKASVLRYGGLRLYRQALPLFYGLILGETVVGLSWTFVTMIWGTRTYGFWGL